MIKDIDQLRAEVARAQAEVDDRDEALRNLEDKFHTENMPKYNDTKVTCEQHIFGDLVMTSRWAVPSMQTACTLLTPF